MVKYGKRRVGKRKMMRRRAYRKPRTNLRQGKIYSFKRTCALRPFNFDGSNWAQASEALITNATTGTGRTGIFKFRLEDLPNPTDFTMLFEQFKITGVKLRFIPVQGTESSSTAGPYTDPLAFCIDRGANDQVFASPSFDSLLENQDVKLRNSQRPFSLWVGTPTFHQPADGLSQGAYKSGWLDSELVNSRGVDYHGVKWAFPFSQNPERSLQFRVYATYYIKCRNPQ